MTEEQALKIASNWHLEAEVQECLDNGDTPIEALYEWDILPEEYFDSMIGEECIK